MDYLILALIIVALLNAATYLYYAANHATGCQLQVWRKARSSNKMNYFIAGIMDQPQPVFRFIKNDVQGGITYVNCSRYGWDPEKIADMIAEDIGAHNYDATIYTISIGDHVARCLDHPFNQNIKIVAINPCSTPQMLRLRWRIVLKPVAVLLFILRAILGWLSVVSLIPAINGKYSLALLTDQLLIMGFDTPRQYTKRTIGVICSQHDQFLDNQAVLGYFIFIGQDRIITLDTQHAYTVREPRLYQEAVRKILTQNTARPR